MTSFPRGILFSDVDGTFLDGGYAPIVEGPRLQALLAGWRLVFVSSRTAAELYALHARIGLRDDAIGENGGVLLTYDADTAQQFGAADAHEEAWIVPLATPIAAVRAQVLPRLTALGAVEVSAGSAAAMAARSGYGESDAQRALDRRTSVLVTDLSPAAEPVLAQLRAEGFTVVHGGRWTSILQGSDKGRAITRWREHCAPSVPTVGVGDAENDAPLLAAVDHPFVISHPEFGPPATLLAIPGARALDAPGPLGWLDLVQTLPSLLTELR
jgi:mannosyl-3-phosphoglycerate phosphatase